MAKRASNTGGKLNLLGDRIRDLREGAGLGQAELARRLQIAGWDIDYPALNKIEKGKRSLTDIEVGYILHVLGKSWIDLDSIAVRAHFSTSPKSTVSKKGYLPN